jgi:hypothetical protein
VGGPDGELAGLSAGIARVVRREANHVHSEKPSYTRSI